MENIEKGGGGWWSWGSSNNKKSSSKKGNTGTQTAPESIPKQPEVAKPSAPKNANPEPGFKKEYTNVQQSSNPQNGQQKPIGWDVPSSPGVNPNGGWKSGYQGVQSGVAKPPAPKNSNPDPGLRKESANVQQSSNPQNGQQRPSGWDVPGSPGANPTGAWKNGNQGYQPHQQGQAYPQHGQSYPQHGQSYPQHGQAYPQHGQAYPQQGHGGYGGGMGGYGGYGGGMGGYGGYGGGYGGYGGGMGGYGGGMGGFGGMGGYGGYGMQKKSGFFSGSTFRNVLTGMFIWHMTSSLLGGFQSKRPYNVYNYYNQPAVQEEIKLPANVLTMCEGNVTQLCTGSTAICTTNSTVLCVLTMSGATPCVEEKTLCVNATVPCNESDDPACRRNATTPQTDAGVAVPCLTNLTVDVNLLNETSDGANGGQQYKYCVTTMAVGGPEYKTCDGGDEGSNDWRSVLEGSYTWNLTLPTMKRPYSVYNHHHPPGDSPSGEVALPAGVLVTCPQNATRLCAPKLTPVCTTFNEIMCLDASTSAEYCEQFNTTCLKADSEGGVLMPCFTNITVDANSPNFNIGTLDGASQNGGVNSSFTYHFRYCVTTLGIPGNETDVCVYGKR